VARTKTPTPTPAPTTPDAPPDPPTQEQARPSPVLAWPAEWPVPELPEKRQRRSRGLPMAPVLAGAGNATAMTATAAYSAGGPVAVAATGVVVAAGATAALVRRRATVRRSVSARSIRATGLGVRGGGGLRSSGVAVPSRSGGGSRRSGGSGGSGGSGLGGGGAKRSGSGLRGAGLRRSGGGSSGTGASRSGGHAGGGLLGKGTGRHKASGGGTLPRGLGSTARKGLKQKLDRKQQRAKDAAAKTKAAKKAIKQAAKGLTSKAGKTGKSRALAAGAARAARAMRDKAHPHTTRMRKAATRTARRSGGALWDALCSAGAGAWTWLRRRDRKSALHRLKAVWARRRHNRAKPDTPAPDTPEIAATVRRPANTAPTSTGGPMSGGGHHFVAPAMELARAAAHYQPQGMLQVGADFAGLEEALRLHAEAMKVTVENADATQPLHPNIVELMRQIHGLQLKAAELASELSPAFRSLHDVDIARLENPRKGAAGERMWDVSANL